MCIRDRSGAVPRRVPLASFSRNETSYAPGATWAVPGLFAQGNAVAITVFVARLRRRRAVEWAPACSQLIGRPPGDWIDQATEIEPFAGGGGAGHPVTQTSAVSVASAVATSPTPQTMPSVNERRAAPAIEEMHARVRVSLPRTRARARREWNSMGCLLCVLNGCCGVESASACLDSYV